MVTELVKINRFSEAAIIQEFEKTWGAMNVLCRRYK